MRNASAPCQAVDRPVLCATRSGDDARGPSRNATMPRRLPLVNSMIQRVGPTVTAIILSNAAVFLAAFVGIHVVDSAAFEHFYHHWLALSVGAVVSGKVWTLFTYGWLHDVDTAMHIVLNMVVVWFLAPPLERRMGGRRFLRFWCVTVLGGGLLCFLAGLFSDAQATTVGASAGAVALVGAWSWLYPERKLLLMFVLPIKARWLVYGVVAVDVVIGLVGSDVAVWAHFGGLLAAWLFLNGWTSPEKLWLRWRRWRLSRDYAHKARMRASLKVLKGGRDDDEDDGPTIN